MDMADTEMFTAIAAPRGHAKTTNLALAFVLYRMAVHREPYTLIVSDTATQAEQRTSDIHAECLENQALVRDYPHLALPDAEHYRKQKAKRTTGDFITVGGLRVMGAGAGQSLRGVKNGANRPTLIVGDDLENDLAVATPAQREKLWNWFTKSLLNLPGAVGARFVIIGTILHGSSLLSRLVSGSDGEAWARRLYRAIDPQTGAVLWPELWSLEKLEAKRALIGSRAFASEYLNDPVDDSLTLFKQAWIDAHRVSAAPALARVAVGVDPSITATGDACGIVAAALGQDRRGYVLEDATVKGTPATWARAALDCAARVGASVIVAEGNQGGEMVEQTLRSVLRPGERLPRVVTVHASRSKQARAEPVAAMYERGEVSHVGTLPLLEGELVTWVPGLPSPNRLDACFIKGTRITTDQGEVPIEEVRPGMMVLTRQGYRRVARAEMTNPDAEVYTMTASNGTRLTGTGNHPIWVKGKGFVPMDALVWGDILETCQENASYSRESSITECQTAQAAHYRFTTGLTTSACAAQAETCCTGQCGFTTTALSPAVPTFTTRTATLLTTTSKIWNWLRRKSTRRLTPPNSAMNGRLTPPAFGPSLLNGTEARRGERYIHALVKIHGKIERYTSGFVRNAVNSLTHLFQIPVFVPQLALTDAIPEQADTSCQSRAPYAGRNSSKTLTDTLLSRAHPNVAQHCVGTLSRQNGTSSASVLSAPRNSVFSEQSRSKHAPVRVASLIVSGRASVYNLEVEDVHEYYANGVLVHNCVWALLELTLKPFVQVADRSGGNYRQAG